MSWFKVDDKAHSHPKTMMAGNAAFGLWARLGSYCSDHLTDGFVPKEVAAAYGTVAEIRALLRVGYVVEVEGGYQLHDFLEYNPTKEQVLAERARNAERQANFRKNKRGDNDSSNGARNGVTNGVSTDAPDPDPTRTPSGVTSQNKTDRQNTAESVGRSVDFEAALSILTAYAEDTSPNPIIRRDRWTETTQNNIVAEKRHDIERLLNEGHTPQETAEQLTGDGLGVRNAMRKRSMEVHPPKGWEVAS